MEHLFNSKVRILRLQRRMKNGRAYNEYVEVPKSVVSCRLDLQFIRPGKDAPPPATAGKAADRFGVCFMSVEAPVRAGDLLECVPNDMGVLPVRGRFEVGEIPDHVQAYSTAHHLEFQVVEVAAVERAEEMAGEEPT